MKKKFQQLASTTGEVSQWIGDKAESVGEAGKALALAASNTSGDAVRAAASGVQSGLSTAKAGVSDATQVTGRAMRAASGVAGSLGGSIVRTVSTIGKTLLDQNGDGHLDQTDVKIATEKTVAAIKGVAVVGAVVGSIAHLRRKK